MICRDGKSRRLLEASGVGERELDSLGGPPTLNFMQTNDPGSAHYLFYVGIVP